MDHNRSPIPDDPSSDSDDDISGPKRQDTLWLKAKVRKELDATLDPAVDRIVKNIKRKNKRPRDAPGKRNVESLEMELVDLNNKLAQLETKIERTSTSSEYNAQHRQSSVSSSQSRREAEDQAGTVDRHEGWSQEDQVDFEFKPDVGEDRDEDDGGNSGRGDNDEAYNHDSDIKDSEPQDQYEESRSETFASPATPAENSESNNKRSRKKPVATVKGKNEYQKNRSVPFNSKYKTSDKKKRVAGTERGKKHAPPPDWKPNDRIIKVSERRLGLDDSDDEDWVTKYRQKTGSRWRKQ